MPNTHCTQCGKPLSAGDKFCAACGHPTGAETISAPATKRDHLIIWGVIAVSVIIFLAVSFMGGGKKETTQQQDSQMPPGENSGMMGGTPTGKAPAKTTFDKAAFIKNLPTDYESIVSMGNALMDQGHYDLAIECYNRALVQKPHEADIRVDLGACQHFLGENENAIGNFKKALEDNPAHQIAKLNLGVAYMSLGDTAQAGSWWRKLMTENPPEEIKTRAENFLKQLK